MILNNKTFTFLDGVLVGCGLFFIFNEKGLFFKILGIILILFGLGKVIYVYFLLKAYSPEQEDHIKNIAEINNKPLTVENRLEEIENLYKKGIISTEEYKQMREKILAEL